MLIKYLFILLQIIFIVRFHLEWSRINVHSEPASSIRKLTNPLVLPLKKLIPIVWVQKFAAVIVAYVIALVGVYILLAGQYDVMTLFPTAGYFLLNSWLLFMQYGMFLYVIGSWIQIPALQRVNYLLYHIFEPVLRPIRSVIPSFGGIDFSPMIALFALSFLARALF